jgi:hypothetical protein
MSAPTLTVTVRIMPNERGIYDETERNWKCPGHTVQIENHPLRTGCNPGDIRIVYDGNSNSKVLYFLFK